MPLPPSFLVLLTSICAFASLTFASRARADEENLIALEKEKQFPAGTLPAWQTQREKESKEKRPPSVSYVRSGFLPLPPPVGYRAPAEFEPVGAYIVTQGDWMGDSMFYDLIIQGTKDGGAHAIVLTRQNVSTYKTLLAEKGVDLARVSVVRPPDGLDARWARDFGPISIYEDDGGEDGALSFIDLHYYDTRVSDDAVAEYLADQIPLQRYGLEGDDQIPEDEYKLYMEGGNYQTDGSGTCILSNDIPSDNDDENNADADTFEEVETILAAYLGCEKVIWLTPVPNTSTGHVDLYTKLLTPDDILVIDMPTDDGVSGTIDAIVDENAAILEAEGFTVHRIMIEAVTDSWIYNTYTNSTILNKIVLMPIYNVSPYDEDAADLYADILGDDFEIIGIDSEDIAPMGGSVHCTTMQIASLCGNGKREPLLEP